MRLTYPPASPLPSNGFRWYRNLNRLSIIYALRLDLGPDLPWADEPSPGNLRLSAGRILTCLVAYSYRHYHCCTLQLSFRSTFYVYSTLPYHSDRILIFSTTFKNIKIPSESEASVVCFSPVTFSAQSHSTSELLRTL